MYVCTKQTSYTALAVGTLTDSYNFNTQDNHFRNHGYMPNVTSRDGISIELIKSLQN